MKKIIFFLVTILACTACKKENTYKMITDQYIKADFGRNQLNYKAVLSANQYLYSSLTTTQSKIDQLDLMASSTDNTKYINIFVLNSDFKNRSLPQNFGKETDISVELQLRDINVPVDTTFGLNDSINYNGIINNFYIENYDSRGYIEGGFSGVISTRTGKSITVNNGSFRLKITEREIE